MVELVIMFAVVVWFARMGRLRNRSALLWGFIGAFSFYAPIYIFSHSVAPAIFGPITVDSPLELSFGVLGIGYALGVISCLLARRSLMRTQPKSIEHIISALEDKNPKVRRAAAQALYHSKDSGAAEPLMVALRDEDYEVRINAAKALYYMKDPRSVEPLTLALKDSNTDVRRIASETLGFLQDIRAVPPLITNLCDPDPNLRDAVKKSLTRITGKDFGEDQTKWNEWVEKNKGE